MNNVSNGVSGIKTFKFSCLKECIDSDKLSDYREGDLLTYKYFDAGRDVTPTPTPHFQVKAILNGTLYVSKHILLTTTQNHWLIHVDLDK